DLLTKEPRENVSTAARRERDHDPDRSCRLAPSVLVGQRQKEGKRKGGSPRCQMQNSTAEKFHDVPLTTLKIFQFLFLKKAPPSPLMAHSRHRLLHRTCPLSRVKQTFDGIR